MDYRYHLERINKFQHILWACCDVLMASIGDYAMFYGKEMHEVARWATYDQAAHVRAAINRVQDACITRNNHSVRANVWHANGTDWCINLAYFANGGYRVSALTKGGLLAWMKRHDITAPNKYFSVACDIPFFASMEEAQAKL